MLRRSPIRPKRLTPRRSDGRITHDRIKRPRVSKTADEAAHLARVALLPCAATGKRPVVVHHIMHMPGKRTRRDHRYVVPLTPAMHNGASDSVHGLGSEARFLEVHGVDLVAEAIRLWEESIETA